MKLVHCAKIFLVWSMEENKHLWRCLCVLTAILNQKIKKKTIGIYFNNQNKVPNKKCFDSCLLTLNVLQTDTAFYLIFK